MSEEQLQGAADEFFAQTYKEQRDALLELMRTSMNMVEMVNKLYETFQHTEQVNTETLH